jgi:hypothetical protein
MLRDALSVFSGSHFATACGVLQNLVVLAIVPPRFIGIWTTIRTVLDYTNYSSLGINRASGVEIAVAAGRHDRTAMERSGNVAMTVELVAASPISVGLFAAAVHCWLHDQLAWSATLATGGAIATISRYYAFNLTVLRSLKQFPTLARARAIGAVVELALFVSGAYFFSYFGMLAAAAVAQLINAYYVRMDGGLRFKFAYDRDLLGRLAQQGWPMAAEALALTALRSVDRFVIVRCLVNGAEQLGWYKIAIVMGAWAFDQSNLVANVLFPRLGETLGRTQEPAAVLRLALRAAEIVTLGMIVCAGALLACGIPVVAWLLPAYRPGLGAAPGMVTAACLLGIAMPLRLALLTISRTRSMLAATALAAGLSCTGGLALLQGSDDQIGTRLSLVAWNSAAAAGVLLFVTIALCLRHSRELTAVGRRIAGLSLYLAAGTACLQAMQAQPVASSVFAGLWIAVPAWTLARIMVKSDW